MSLYDDMLQQAERMRNNFKDLVDKPNEPEARYVRQEVEGLISDLNSNKNGMTVDNRLKNLEHHLRQLNQEIMDYNHSNMLADMCEDMRHHTRDL